MELRRLVREALLKCNQKEIDILTLRYGLDGSESMTLEEIGNVYSVTGKRISQIILRALRKLRHPVRSRNLRDFLEVVR